MIRALLIGCGNIGAGYDLHDEKKVLSHAKAYAKTAGITLSVFDADPERAQQIAEKYKAVWIENLDESTFGEFDLISITTPTPTHFHYLSKALAQKVPVILCEKPVVNEIVQAIKLEELYKASDSKVLVNYIRRFQPAYATLKDDLRATRLQQLLRAIVIKYKRGFLNNASHAIDLLEYLLEEPFTFPGFHCTHAEFDAFDYDPTLTGSCLYKGIPVSFVGVPQVSYTLFELELFFESKKVVICHSGNEIRYYLEVKGNLIEKPEARQENILNMYMSPVLEAALDCFVNKSREDNFVAALRLNKELLQIIETIKPITNATISN